MNELDRFISLVMWRTVTNTLALRSTRKNLIVIG